MAKYVEYQHNCDITYKDIVTKQDIDNVPTADVIEIPKGATNGDMFMDMFKCMVIDISDSKVYVEGIFFPFDESWWNTPYKKEVEE